MYFTVTLSKRGLAPMIYHHCTEARWWAIFETFTRLGFDVQFTLEEV
jgi:hypothetical protein